MTLKKLSYSCVAWTTVVLIYAVGGECVGAASTFGGAGVVSGWVGITTFLGVVLSRVLFAYLAWSASHAKRIILVSDNSDTIKDCILLIVLAGVYSFFLLFFDVTAFVLIVTCWHLVNVSVVGGAACLCVVLLFCALHETLLCLAIMNNLHSIPPVERAEVLSQIKLNNIIVVE